MMLFYYKNVDTVDIDFHFKYLPYPDSYMYHRETPNRVCVCVRERESNYVHRNAKI